MKETVLTVGACLLVCQHQTLTVEPCLVSVQDLVKIEPRKDILNVCRIKNTQYVEIERTEQQNKM